MRPRIPEPQRLLDVAPTEHAGAAEQRAAALLRGAGEPAALSPQVLVRIKARVLSGAPRRAGTWRVKLTLAAALLIATSGVVFAAQGWWRDGHRGPTRALPGASARVSEPGRPVAFDATPTPGVTAFDEGHALPTPALEATSVAPPAPPLMAASAESAAKPKIGAHEALDPMVALRESRLLSEALVELRRDNDPRVALTLLDQYGERFPNGSLALEATRARAEAFVMLGRRAEALRVLDKLSPAALGRSMLLVRAELRAELSRCSDALGDFSSALSQNPHDGVDERALFGRATCRSRAGDATGSRSDLNLYALRFPRGRFQVQVARALQK